ncbi:methylated-DNA--[protein]-cysteine S-methyltransferase [Xenophilus sp. Marseille-Q4582]|uniref:methylated-DNA--[protein]-cysteine S-methyltransferase n=1 Tax=Xenophilus sp. Marseille-Q4582 TaxID=2866600 RepID=UPI001CE3E611|nr:methylated-DNA--[protein]-cysteine S-methyltransferase [Xenophilus sp. Marseille-Q4582]
MRFPPSLPLRQRRIATPLGAVLLARTDAGLAGLWFDGQRHSPDSRCVQRWAPDEGDALLREAERQLLDYFAGRRPAFDLPLDLSHGTPFQQAVWRALCAIPRGQTLRYGALAAQIGQPAAARAVGAAVGRNPLSVVVPCHRVIGADGSLTGYAGGLPRKVQLLTLEGIEGLAAPSAGASPPRAGAAPARPAATAAGARA